MCKLHQTAVFAGGTLGTAPSMPCHLLLRVILAIFFVAVMPMLANDASVSQHLGYP